MTLVNFLVWIWYVIGIAVLFYGAQVESDYFKRIFSETVAIQNLIAIIFVVTLWPVALVMIFTSNKK